MATFEWGYRQSGLHWQGQGSNRAPAPRPSSILPQELAKDGGSVARQDGACGLWCLRLGVPAAYGAVLISGGAG
eukprot:scaffold182341_cov15-Tisochrysis_lutea.AAC.1